MRAVFTDKRANEDAGGTCGQPEGRRERRTACVERPGREGAYEEQHECGDGERLRRPAHQRERKRE